MVTYVCGGKRFCWRAIVVAHLLDPEDTCKRCGGSGRVSTFHGGIGDDDDDGKCKECRGGKISWYSPMFSEHDIAQELQKCLNKFLEDKEAWRKANPPFIGAGL